MKILRVLVAIILVSLFSCSKKNNLTDEQISQIENEIAELETFDAKKLYLENIFFDDQAVRDDSDLILKYGMDSPKFSEYIKAQLKQDEINLVKIEKYLETYGYPDKKMGPKATTSPWIVIHHAPGYQIREKYFEIVYEAYLKDNITENAISFYLGRMYSKKNGERLRMESPYKQEDEINLLIKELNLDKKKIKVQKQLENTNDNI
ncbi:hypothetical protein [Psychroflexus aestuariivivens]|uniref:hypothetical protein n=1 Tax=Psychroflexus aestuariivivens TaxID=1795040 RepID=UPI000FDC5EC1|nr:hypothetical protein [Psychroflexus aestuariivivens]